jgi:hypothetical protein
MAEYSDAAWLLIPKSSAPTPEALFSLLTAKELSTDAIFLSAKLWDKYPVSTKLEEAASNLLERR